MGVFHVFHLGSANFFEPDQTTFKCLTFLNDLSKYYISEWELTFSSRALVLCLAVSVVMFHPLCVWSIIQTEGVEATAQSVRLAVPGVFMRSHSLKTISGL